MRCHMALIPVLRKQRQDDQKLKGKLETSLGYSKQCSVEQEEDKETKTFTKY